MKSIESRWRHFSLHAELILPVILKELFFFFLLLPTHAIVSLVLPPKTKPQSDTPCCPLTTVKMLQATLSGHRCYLTSAKRSRSRALTTTTRSNNRVCLVKAAKGLPLPPTSKWKHLMPFKVAAPKPPVGPLCWCLHLKLLLYEHSFFMLDLKKTVIIQAYSIRHARG